MNKLTSHLLNFEKLGVFFSNFEKDKKKHQQLLECITKTQPLNSWFTPSNVFYAFKIWGQTLTKENLEHWASKYRFYEKKPKKIGIVLPSNIPLVGLHDLFCILLSGNIATIKMSTNDPFLMPFVADLLFSIDSNYKNKIFFTPSNFKSPDAIIATGNNNTARYFEYYFSKYPHIIRKNRNSIAILNGQETANEIKKLCIDITCYFGLGCRNISKLYLPKNYDLNIIFKALYDYKYFMSHTQYMNNYDYYKAFYIMNNEKVVENGFFILKKDKKISPPIATLFYEEYSQLKQLKEKIELEQENIQCIVGAKNLFLKNTPFGETQKPKLWDYSDGIDTLDFLLNI